MDPNLYRAVMESNIGVLMQNQDQLNVQATSLNKNTVLHVATQFSQTTSVREILELCPSLLYRTNIADEIPLHIAAREGHFGIVRALIDCAKLAHNEGASGEDPESGLVISSSYKEMLWMKNEEGDTALHEAVRNNHPGVVELLIKEDPEFVHSVNKSGEAPLYIAAEKGYNEIVCIILNICKEPAYGGPVGRTALHAALIACGLGSIRKLLEWKQALTREVDEFGWTPLHCAARVGNASGVGQLLEMDKSLAYITTADNDDKKTALHIAAGKGYVFTMKELLSHCPDCWETINARGQNILHVAVEFEKKEIIEFIVQNSWVNHLLNKKDVDGNTPLHLLAASDFHMPNLIIRHPRVDKGVFNKANLTPRDVSISIDSFRNYEDDIKKALKEVDSPWGWRNIVRKDIENMRKWKKARADNKRVIPRDITKTGETHLIVAALIATVTFAAGFTLPGGYDGNEGPDQGMAILSRKAAFKAFVVTDTIAMVFSISAVFVNFIASHYPIRRKIVNRYVLGLSLIVVAMAAMVIAFITGTYAVLGNSLSLAIAVCIVSCFSFLVYFIAIRKSWQDFA